MLRHPLTTALALLAAAAMHAPVGAHPDASDMPVEARAAAQVATFRAELQRAAARRDAQALRASYTDDFTHTHTSGKVDGKDARVASLLADEATVETAATPELRLSCYGDSVCVARALSPIRRADAKWFDVRWTQTYVRTPGGWRIAVSQATALPATVRDSP